MNTQLVMLIVLAAVTASCSKPSSQPTPAPPKQTVRWFTNAQGFIVSEVKPNDFKSSMSTNESEMRIHFDGSKQIHDPLEDAAEFAAAFRDANAQANAATQRWKGQLGRVHLFWEKKKEVLRDKYRIEWKSPADLNPMTSYD